MPNSAQRIAARSLANYLTTNLAATTRPNMKRIRVNSFNQNYIGGVGGFNFVTVFAETITPTSGTLNIIRIAPPGYPGSPVESREQYDNAVILGEGVEYWFSDSTGFNISSVPSGSIVDDGVSDYNDIPASSTAEPDATSETVYYDQFQPIPTTAASSSGRIKLVLPDFVCSDLVTYGYYKEAIEEYLNALENRVTNFTNQLFQGELILQQCKERRLIPGGWETTAQLQELLQSWQQVLAIRGTETGIKNEVNRIHNADDAAITWEDYRWFLGQRYPGVDEENPVVLGLPPVMVVTVTHNNTYLFPHEKAVRVIKDKLVPLQYSVKVVHLEGTDANLGFGSGGFGSGGFGG